MCPPCCSASSVVPLLALPWSRASSTECFLSPIDYLLADPISCTALPKSEINAGIVNRPGDGRAPTLPPAPWSLAVWEHSGDPSGAMGCLAGCGCCADASLTPSHPVCARGAASLWIWPIYLQESRLCVSLGISSCCLIMQGSVLPHLSSLLNGGFALN